MKVRAVWEERKVLGSGREKEREARRKCRSDGGERFGWTVFMGLEFEFADRLRCVLKYSNSGANAF